jgi:chemotaxis protein methyltransferase CheR
MPEDRTSPRSVDLESLEVDLLTQAIYEAYGFDFRRYSRASLRRRLRRRMDAEGVATVSALQDRVLHDRACMSRLFADLSVHVSSMFRDPGFYQAFRERVVPLLRTYPFVRIWNAGCATGEETYSIAIILRETGLYERARVYATDLNPAVLEQARTGVFPIAKMQEYTSNYIQAGGSRSFSEYYVADGGRVSFHPSLAENIVFAEHNLVTDRSFNEFHVIVCRNVMIYFDRVLQERVHDLFYSSLITFGVLGLGSKESLASTDYRHRYAPLDETARLYRKVR